jgi:hypothetical protein
VTVHHNTRKTHCRKGHPLSGDNLVIHNDGRRRCRICIRAKKRPVDLCGCGREKNLEAKTCWECYVDTQSHRGPGNYRCGCGERMVRPAEKCGFCEELEYGGEPMPDLGLELAA